LRSEYRFELEKGGLKYACPECGRIRFVRYVDTVTGEQVAIKLQGWIWLIFY